MCPFSCLFRRCMGWLIRFIHNRHHACENIVQAYSRHMILMQSHGGLSRDDLDELCVAGMDLPANSMLSPTKVRHGTPGSYHVNVKPSRRNSTEDSELSPVLLQIVRDLCRRYGLGTPSPLGLILTFGVTLNGRDVRRDDFCLYVPVLVRRNVRDSHPDVASQVLCGRVCEWYQTICDDGDNKVAHLFVVIQPLRIHSTHRSLLVLQKSEIEAPVETVTMIHVDNITFKLASVPHFSDSGLLMLIRMWETR